MGPRFVRRRLALVLLFLLAGCQAAPAPGPEPDRLTRFFDELNFGGAGERDPPTLVRWTEPSLAYAVIGTKSPADRTLIASRLEHFQFLTGIKVVRGSPETAPLIIEMTREPLGPVHDELSPCLTRLTWRQGSIVRARVMFNTDTKGALAGCLDHELMHAFGFRYHSGIEASVMSPFRLSNRLSAADEAVLRTLYDPRLTPGMERQAALSVAGGILAASSASAGETVSLAALPLATQGENAPADFDWHTIRAADTALVFAPPSLAHATSHHYWAMAPDGHYIVEVSLWAAARATRPRAALRYVSLPQNRRFNHDPSPDEAALLWRSFGDRSVKLGPPLAHDTALIRARYAVAATDLGPCIVFVANVPARHPAQTGPGRIDGYYCAAAGTTLDDGAAGTIIDALEFREPGYRAP